MIGDRHYTSYAISMLLTGLKREIWTAKAQN